MRIKMKAIRTTEPDSDSSSLMGSPLLMIRDHHMSLYLHPPLGLNRLNPIKPTSGPSRPVHIDLTQEIRSKKRQDQPEAHSPSKKGKEKCTPSTSKGSSSKCLFKNRQTEEIFKSKFKDLFTNTDRQDFGSLFERDEDVYPVITCAFYAAASVTTSENGTPSIKSCLKGIEMELNMSILCTIIGLKDNGVKFYEDQDWMTKAEVIEEEVGRALFINGQISKDSKKLNNISKLLFNLVSKTLIPRGGSFEKMTPLVLILLFHLRTGRLINLPFAILKHIVHAHEYYVGSVFLV
ncbi:hypothetical protein SESBI_05628 [Sesbania bispinosa]|nr:hypothetical protein SESBI_05628 [Sesbania bispinosa]